MQSLTFITFVVSEKIATFFFFFWGGGGGVVGATPDTQPARFTFFMRVERLPLAYMCAVEVCNARQHFQCLYKYAHACK